jgi:tRNA(Ile)-lysidine synthase
VTVRGQNVNNVVARVEKTIAEHDLLVQGERVVVALSGGPDSVCLLHVLTQIAPQHELKLSALHVHHGLRESAEDDARYSEHLAADLGVEFCLRRVSVPEAVAETGESVQQAARRLRYQELERFAEKTGAQRIAVGHHRDDQAETVLLNFLRGSGLRGLRGKKPKHGRIIRPLLDVRRNEVEEYCAAEGLEPCLDPTNLKQDYLRNQLRHALLPHLKEEYNPNLSQHLAQLADIVAAEYSLLQQRTRQLAEKQLVETESGFRIELDTLKALELADQRRLTRFMYRRLLDDAAELGYTHVNSVLKLVREGEVHSHLELPEGVKAVRGYHTLELTLESCLLKGGADYRYILEVPGETNIEEIDATVRTTVKERAETPTELDMAHLVRGEYFDYNKIELPLVVRNRRPGDRFQPLGMEGSKKLKDFFIDEKVPRALREQLPIVLAGDTIIWVAGYRIGHSVRITPETTAVLTVELLDGEKFFNSGDHLAGPSERGL